MVPAGPEVKRISRLVNELATPSIRRELIMSSKALIALSGVLLLAGVTGLLSGCGRSHAASPSSGASEAAPEITAAQVIARPLHHWEELTGTLQAVNVGGSARRASAATSIASSSSKARASSAINCCSRSIRARSSSRSTA